ERCSPFLHQTYRLLLGQLAYLHKSGATLFHPGLLLAIFGASMYKRSCVDHCFWTQQIQSRQGRLQPLTCQKRARHWRRTTSAYLQTTKRTNNPQTLSANVNEESSSPPHPRTDFRHCLNASHN